MLLVDRTGHRPEGRLGLAGAVKQQRMIGPFQRKIIQPEVFVPINVLQGGNRLARFCDR
jgi:hypothetical protein